MAEDVKARAAPSSGHEAQVKLRKLDWVPHGRGGRKLIDTGRVVSDLSPLWTLKSDLQQDCWPQKSISNAWLSWSSPTKLTPRPCTKSPNTASSPSNFLAAGHRNPAQARTDLCCVACPQVVDVVGGRRRNYVFRQVVYHFAERSS